MHDAMGAGMLRGWVMLWNLQLTWLLAATAASIALGVAVEGIAAFRRRRGWGAPAK